MSIPLGAPTRRAIPFKDRGGLAVVVSELTEEIRELYQADSVPWVVGYSGGKDSTAVLQLVWLALQGLPADKRSKPVHVISTDTLVENPIVASWVTQSLVTMGRAAKDQQLPIAPHRLTPEVKDTFWVGLIGRGYPAPRPKFRWCTERLKIRPSNRFIREVVREHGETILVLGIRKAESQMRAKTMAKHEKRRVRERLSPNGNLPNSLVYSPIEEWSNDEVWTFLMQQPNPWGHENKDLLTMYQGASSDGECPLVVDNTTPSCGDSRFGCWTCTLVDQDKSMSAMIQNDEEKEWMLPLLELRNKLDVRNEEGHRDDKHLRDWRKMNGTIQLFNDRVVHGPYTQQARGQWLRDLLNAQTWIRKNAPHNVRGIELITMDELHEIRRIWVFEKHEIEDLLPRIYEEETGEEFPGKPLDEHLTLAGDEMELLREVCGDDDLHFTTVRELMGVERKYRTMRRRAGLFEELEKTIRRGYYEDKDDAEDYARRIRAAQEAPELPFSDEEAANVAS
ncbi:DNA phosphorothioation system sulfurtransferase DndC [Actinoallomurus purpureus]|uniref:DNA phosphorothioation system sulfurtransferase DndC n=1 Tax=Actinoallomurus purpureus TaxID=478114 RepID=UPI0020925223|nr:DNA phosphorothioation system sulfurtransferase DndC [Actinoallomurus purpureus]MCO6008276.1 DNA phosphorothioation system sulfurtransferase DndC [Actinoallomurus purpureus]